MLSRKRVFAYHHALLKSDQTTHYYDQSCRASGTPKSKEKTRSESAYRRSLLIKMDVIKRLSIKNNPRIPIFSRIEWVDFKIKATERTEICMENSIQTK